MGAVQAWIRFVFLSYDIWPVALDDLRTRIAPFFFACLQSPDAQERPKRGDGHRNQRDRSLYLVPEYFPYDVISFVEAESRDANDGNNDHTNAQA